MTLPAHISDLEKSKFVEVAGETTVRVTGTLTVSPITGAATEAKQDDGNASLASIDTKLTSPLTVSLPADAATETKQDAGNTSLASIDTKLTSPLSVAQSGAWSTGRTWVLDSATDDVVAVQGGTWSVGRTWALGSGTDSIAAVQSGTWNITNVSGTVSLPTGAATAANQATAIASLASIDTKLTSPITVTGVLSSKTPLTPSAPAAATAGTSSAQVVAANANRKGLVITNISSNTVYFGLGATAALLSGIRLNPNSIWYMDEFSFTTGAINAIASAASSNLSIQEFST